MKTYRRTSGISTTVRAPFFWVLLAIMLSPRFTVAQTEGDERRCFGDDPARSVCVGEAFRPFWEHHGGVAIFGEPLAAPTTRSTPDGEFAVQYFDKARLELHPEAPPPYHLLLGRIGRERLDALGRGAEIDEAENSTADCRFFAATAHTVCGEFLEYWRSHGLRLDGDPAIAEAESLALLGLPLSSMGVELGPSGEMLRTQWFERAKLVENAGIVSSAPLGRESAFPEPPPTAVERTPTPSAVGSVIPAAPAEPTPDAVSPPPVAPIRHVSYPAIPCNRNVPVPANGLQLWVITEPEQMIVCVRLILDGEAIAGANTRVYRHYHNETLPTISHTTGLYYGAVAFIFYTGGSRGRPDQLEAIASYRGVTYRATALP